VNSSSGRKTLLFLAVLLFFFVSGACGLLYQVVWTRKLVLLFGTTSYAVSTVLSVFFLGLGAGSLWGGRLADRGSNPLRLYALFEIIIGLWALFFLLAVSHGEGLVVFLLKAFDFSRAAGIALRAIMASLLLFVPVALMGATLPLLAKFVTWETQIRGMRIGALYAINTLGAVAGCFLTGFVLIAQFGYTQTTLIGAAANVLVGVLALLLARTHWEQSDAKTVVDFESGRPPHPNPLPAYPTEGDYHSFRRAGRGDQTAACTDDDPAAPVPSPRAPGLEGNTDTAGRGERDRVRGVRDADATPVGDVAFPVGDSPPLDDSRVTVPVARLSLAAFALSGFCALALEVLWTRLLTIVFLGTTYAYTTMLTTLLCGIALGGAAGSLLVDRSHRRSFVFGLLVLLNGAACILTLSLLAGLPERIIDLQRSSGGNWQKVVTGKFLYSFVTLILPTFLSGMSFPFVVRILSSYRDRLGRDIGTLYSANTFGGMLGALAGGFVLLPLIGSHHSILLLALLLVGMGSLLLLCSNEIRLSARVAVLALGLVFAASAWHSAPEDVNTQLNVGYVPEDHRVLHTREGVEGTVVVSEPVDEPAGTNRVLWINRVQATTSIERGVKMNRLQGVLPLVFDRDPESVLFMCFGSGITAGTLALWDFERMDAVEISPDVLDAAPYFEVDNLKVIENPKVQFHIDDGRNFLLAAEQYYDVITFEPMPLALAGVSTFYTREYYQLCLKHLAPRGLVSQWVPLHSLNPEVVRSLVYTFTESFPHYCTFFVNADLFLIGSDAPLYFDYEALEERMRQPRLQKALAEVGLPDPAEVIAHFLLDEAGMRTFAAGGELLTDDRPWAEFVAPRLVYERKVPEAARASESSVCSSRSSGR